MDLSSKTRRERLHWPWATALVLMLAAAPAFADDERCDRPPPTKRPWDTKMDNPCFKNPATFGRGERDHEQVLCDRADQNCGTLTTTTRNCVKGDRSEFRQQITGDGFGRGDRSTVRYDARLDRLTVIRSRPGDNRFTSRDRQMGNPERKTALVGDGNGMCSPDNPAGCASPFVVNVRTETRNGVPVGQDTEPDTECKNKDGGKRGEHDD